MDNRQRKPTAGIILAAGMSTRLGQSKQLVTIGGTSVLERVINAAMASELDQLFLVLGQDGESIRQVLAHKIQRHKIHVVVNPKFQEGMSSSLKAGLNSAMDFPSVMFLLGDQPLIDGKFINTLLHAFWNSESLILAPRCGKERKNPAIFLKRLYREIQAISGDKGARAVIEQHKEKTSYVEFDDPLLFLDIDTQKDIEIAKKASTISNVL